MNNKMKFVYVVTLGFYIVFLLLANIHCIRKNKEFEDIFSILRSEFDRDFTTTYKDTPENEIIDSYFLVFFNRYIEVKKRNPIFSAFGENYNLQTEASQSYVLALLWHRDLNQKELKIQDLLRLANSPKIGVNACKNQRKINSVYSYKKYEPQDAIQLKLPVQSEEDAFKMAVYYDCPLVNWNFDATKDLLIEGRLVGKLRKGFPDEMFFKVKIEKMNKKDVIFLFRKISAKDTIELSLYYYGMLI